MIEILKVHKNGIEFRASGRIAGADYRRVRPEAERIISECGFYSALVDICEVESLKFEAIWEDLKFDIRYFRRTKRISFITNRRSWWLYLTSIPFATGGVRFFEPSEIAAAQQWTFDQP